MRFQTVSVLTLAITLFPGAVELRAAENGSPRKLPPPVDVYEFDISLDTDGHTLEVRRMILHYGNVGDRSLDEITARTTMPAAIGGWPDDLRRFPALTRATNRSPVRFVPGKKASSTLHRNIHPAVHVA